MTCYFCQMYKAFKKALGYKQTVRESFEAGYEYAQTHDNSRDAYHAWRGNI